MNPLSKAGFFVIGGVRRGIARSWMCDRWKNGMLRRWVKRLPGLLILIAGGPVRLSEIVSDGRSGEDVGANPLDDIVHVHIAGLVAESVIAVEDGAVHGAHPHAVGGVEDSAEGEGGVIAFEEEAAAGGVVVDRQAVGGRGGKDGGIPGSPVQANERDQCSVIVAGVVDVEIVDCLIQGDQWVSGVPFA